MHPGTLTDLNARGVDVYNAGDIEAFSELYAEDAVMSSPDGTCTGRAAIRDYWSDQATAFPGCQLRVVTYAEAGDRIPRRVRMEWDEHWAPPPAGRLRAAGNRESGGDPRHAVIQVHDSKFVVHRLYWDSTLVLSQLGAGV